MIQCHSRLKRSLFDQDLLSNRLQIMFEGGSWGAIAITIAVPGDLADRWLKVLPITVAKQW